MTLIACPECRNDISDHAPTCIHCGYPLTRGQPRGVAQGTPRTFWNGYGRAFQRAANRSRALEAPFHAPSGRIPHTASSPERAAGNSDPPPVPDAREANGHLDIAPLPPPRLGPLNGPRTLWLITAGLVALLCAALVPWRGIRLTGIAVAIGVLMAVNPWADKGRMPGQGVFDGRTALVVWGLILLVGFGGVLDSLSEYMDYVDAAPQRNLLATATAIAQSRGASGLASGRADQPSSQEEVQAVTLDQIREHVESAAGYRDSGDLDLASEQIDLAVSKLEMFLEPGTFAYQITGIGVAGAPARVNLDVNVASTPVAVQPTATTGGQILSSPVASRPAAMSCSDFATQRDAQNAFRAFGGPRSDPYGLDPDRNGVACDQAVGTPTPAIVSPADGPARITAQGLDDSTIRLAWVDWTNDEEGFLIMNSDKTVTAPRNATTIDVGGLVPDSYQCFGIYAYNQSGVTSGGTACARTSPTPRR